MTIQFRDISNSGQVVHFDHKSICIDNVINTKMASDALMSDMSFSWDSKSIAYGIYSNGFE